ncbi:hypothetical protein BD311DRAFT_869248 [Dichomitus squalens]|uniref:DUF6535 domain-containing protein n=1 Tax=Dichomitus squalens TaxID=114155 RepID=A0A4Q9MAI0_9APHY|nr:hypothetical protein BD311DRAFT_869248 [Dichomitus squalens]
MTSPDAEASQIVGGASDTSTPGQRQEPSTSNEASQSGPATSQRETAEVPNSQGTRGASSTSFGWKLPKIDDLSKEFEETYTQAERDKALSEPAQIVKTYSDEMVKRWNEEIDNLLVYAGLFSSILTAFNVQSYLLLQPATPDPTLAVLQQISLQLNSFSVNPPGTLVNSTHPVTAFAPVPMAPVETWAVWLNSLWFSALICSLSSASVGILVKQWLHEYEAGISGDSSEFARLRQYRLNRLEKWHLAEIVAVLPVLLQISLFLFFAGLLILLWHYHSTVAIVASVLVGVVTFFVVATTVMPTIWYDCCYLSPPTYAMYPIVQHVKSITFWAFAHIMALPLRLLCQCLARLAVDPHRDQSWFKHLIELFDKAINFEPETSSSLRGREQTTVQESSSRLDVDMVLHAYTTTMDVRHISGLAAEVILAGTPLDTFKGFYKKVEAVNQQHFGAHVGWTRCADAWAGALIHTSRRETVNFLIESLLNRRYSYGSRLTVGHYHRLFLALTAAVATPDSGFLAHRWSLWLLDELFTFNRAALALMPWKAVRHVAAAVEMRLRQLLHPSDDEPAQEPHSVDVFRSMRILENIFSIDPAGLEIIPWTAVRNVAAVAETRLRQLLHLSDDEPAQEPEWHAIFRWLSILARCCFAPVSSWMRSQEETKALTACIFGMDLLQKGSIAKIAGKLEWSDDAKAVLETLDIILTYLCESEDARRGPPGDFLEAVGELVEDVKGRASRKSWPWWKSDVQEALKKLKRSLERCKSLGLGFRAEGKWQASLPDPKAQQVNTLKGIETVVGTKVSSRSNVYVILIFNCLYRYRNGAYAGLESVYHTLFVDVF